MLILYILCIPLKCKNLSQKVANTISRTLGIIWYGNTFTYRENGASSCNVSEKTQNFKKAVFKLFFEVFKKCLYMLTI